MVHFRGGRKTIDIHAYPDMDEFFADLAQCYRDEMNSLYRAGCRYLQMDDTNLAYLCDPKLRAGARERGLDPDHLPRDYAALINSVIDGRPKDLTIAVHLCRGNFKSAWVAEGGYEPVAEVLFNELNVDGSFLEYDDERAGDFRPLRFVPKHKTVVLGLVTTKVGALESRAGLITRIKEAAQFMPLENMCLSLQCGFSSTVEGKPDQRSGTVGEATAGLSTWRERCGATDKLRFQSSGFQIDFEFVNSEIIGNNSELWNCPARALETQSETQLRLARQPRRRDQRVQSEEVGGISGGRRLDS